jgi:N-methylhydantoinase A/oxoprolinase/acetone carboxylase beta subunit
MSLRVGIDVGGTFTKAVAVDPRTHEIHASSVVPTSHAASAGVGEGVAEALRALIAGLGERGADVELVAFSTTQAMNALLEGDVPLTGIVGLGSAPDVRRARKRTRVGRIALAPGRALETVHEFVDCTRGIDEAAIDAALSRLEAAGCEAVAVSGAFSVDGPEHEVAVIEHAVARGLPACGGHELTGAYGLETRTVSAAINASVLPAVRRAAAVVEGALAEAGLDVPLLVLRGDGGAMSIDGFAARPSFTVGSGPASGVAAALHQLGLRDAIVVECGGTSTNVSVVKHGRPILRSLRVMGRPTCIRAIDSWVVGAAGGSLARARRGSLVETGPRSAHIAGLPYACFAPPALLDGARLSLLAPRPGDPDEYAVVSAGGLDYALTTTCAANALGLVPEGAHSHGSQRSALAAFAALGGDPAENARRLLDGAVDKIVAAVTEAARTHELPGDVPLVAVGGAGEALVPEVARRVRRPVVRPSDPEVLSSVGAALALVRAEVVRTSADAALALDAAHEAELACVAAGAAPATVTVDTRFDPREGVLRAVATGAVALETGAADRPVAAEAERLAAACAALDIDAASLQLIASTDFYRVYSENGSGRVAVVDIYGAVPLAESARRIFADEGERFVERLRSELAGSITDLAMAQLLPRVSIVAGPQIIDLSDARREDEIVRAAERTVGRHAGPAVAVLVR